MLAAPDLLPCPDCDNGVSPRAAFCPRCGCPIEYIKAAAEAERPTEAERPFLLRVQTDRGEGIAIAARFPDGDYLLLHRHLIDGVQALELTPYGTNAPVPYLGLELAHDRPLARLPTPTTNLAPVVVSPAEQDAALALVTDGDSPVWRPAANPIAVGFGADARTNLTAVYMGSLRVPVTREVTWTRVSPKTFREQSARLLAMRHKAPGDDVQQTGPEPSWLTPQMAQEFEATRVLERDKEDTQ